MNEREALEKIKEEARHCLNWQEGLNNIINIATQALAPQEPQEKTFTLEEIKRILKNLHKKEFYDCGECTECLLAEFEKECG